MNITEIKNNNINSIRYKYRYKLLSKFNDNTKPRIILSNDYLTNNIHNKINSNIDNNNNIRENITNLKKTNQTIKIRQDSIRTRYKHLLKLGQKKTTSINLNETNIIKVNTTSNISLKIKVNKNENLITKKDKLSDKKIYTEIKDLKESPIKKNHNRILLYKNINNSNIKKFLDFNKDNQYNTLNNININEIKKEQKIRTKVQKRRDINLKIFRERNQPHSVNKLNLKFNEIEEDKKE